MYIFNFYFLNIDISFTIQMHEILNSHSKHSKQVKRVSESLFKP